MSVLNAKLLTFFGFFLLVLSSGGDEGMVTYRLRTRTGKLIFLRSRGIIEYDAKKEIVSFVCVNEMIK